MAILGLDVSTSVIGISIFDDNHKLLEISHIKFNKGTDLFIKLDEFIEFFKKYESFNITEVAVEEALKAFRGKYSSADTIQKLTQMNALICGYLYIKLGIKPNFINATHARKLVFPHLKLTEDGKSVKDILWAEFIKLYPHINWTYSKKTFKLDTTSYDMMDSCIVSLAHIIMKINPPKIQFLTKKVKNKSFNRNAN